MTAEPRRRENVAAAAAAPADDLLDRLDRGPLDERFNPGIRFDPQQMASRDALSPARGIWPVRASASSTYGSGWSPSALVGPPRVWPSYGDTTGAWAPAEYDSDVEWIELDYDVPVAITTVRVFETNSAGNTFAIVDRTGHDRLLYADETVPAPSSARVLEVPVDPPRVVRKLRVYVRNRHWAEIDTVGLLAERELPVALRAAPPRRSGWMWAFAAIFVLAAMGVGASTYVRGHLTARAVRPRMVLQGARWMGASAMPAGVQWASSVVAKSSEYGASRNAADDVLGAPDVYPRNGDYDGAWAPRETDRGEEWITVRLPTRTVATAVVWVETLNPGAVVRVDDLTEGAAPTVLWEGITATTTVSRVSTLTLPTARPVQTLRLVLRTDRTSGWEELDAIGVIPAR